MQSKALDDFIKYAKEQFGYDIILKKEDKSDSFESIFGASFLEQNPVSEVIEEFDNELQYENNYGNVCLVIPDEIELSWENLEFAA